MSTDNDQPDPMYDAADAHLPDDTRLRKVHSVITWGPDGTYRERHVPRRNNRTAWIAVIVVALVALLAAVIFYAKQSRDHDQQIMSDYACAMQADAAGATSWQVVDGRCVTQR